jgi:ribosomal-protein-alanine N-acetyltransferase
VQRYLIASGSEADLDAVLAIDRLCFPAPWPEQAFRDELCRPWAHVEILCEVESRRVVAFCNYWIVADELQILTVAVHPDERRRGHAARLVQHMLDEGARAKVRVASLEVRASNEPAQALYRKLGFHDVGRRPRYYADNGEDAVLMDREMTA